MEGALLEEIKTTLTIDVVRQNHLKTMDPAKGLGRGSGPPVRLSEQSMQARLEPI